MNVILLGHPAVEPAGYARGLADQLWRKAVDMTAQPDAKALAACLARDEQVIALDGASVLDPEFEAVLGGDAKCQVVYLECRPDALAARCGDADAARAFTDRADPVCRRLAGQVFDVSELAVDSGLRHLIRKCM